MSTHTRSAAGEGMGVLKAGAGLGLKQGPPTPKALC